MVGIGNSTQKDAGLYEDFSQGSHSTHETTTGVRMTL